MELTIKITPGFLDCSHDDYHSDPCPIPSLSRSVAAVMIEQSPRHAWSVHPRLNPACEPFDATGAMDMGEIGHQLLLGQAERIAAFDGDSWRTKEAKLFKEQAKAAKLVPVLAHKLAEARAMAEAVRSQLDEGGFSRVFCEGKMEQTICWKSGESWLRSRLDNLIINEASQRAEIWDLKTTTNANPKAISRKIFDMVYDLQDAFYSAGLAALRPELAGRIDFNFVFAEAAPPFAICIVTLNGEGKTIGVSKFSRALALWEQCMKGGKWPAYLSGSVAKVEPPPWALAGEIGADSISDVMNRK